jgi:hypothetical protein
MSKRLLSVLIAGLFASAPALAQLQSGDTLFHGSVSVGGLGTDIDSKDPGARAEEYRDLSDSVIEVIDVRARNRSNKAWADLFMENLGRDDMYISLRGGQYDLWKGRVYTDWLRHRFVDNARSPFDGLGGNALRTTFPRPDIDNWNTFDVNYKRKDTGGFFEWQSFSPWYFRVDGNSIRFDGTKLLAGSNGSSPGNGFTDLIAPVDWRTDTVTVEGGYNTRTMHFAASWMHSKFNNGNEALTWTNPFFANGIDTTHLPADNKTDRFAANATFRQLPYSSTAALRYTWQEVKSDASFLSQVLAGTAGTPAAPVFSPVGATEDSFHGKHNFQTFTAALASVPMQNLDTRLYYNYYRLKNESNDLEFFGNAPGSPGAIAGRPTVNCAGGPCEGEHFGYTKHNVGFDGFWKVARGHRIGFGWDYVDRDLEHRTDYDNSRENKLFAEYKNTQVENFVGRIKYTFLQRRADFLRHDEGVNANDPLFLERFVGRFDLMDLDQNNVKVLLDWSPMPLLDLSAEYTWKENKYKDQALGRNKDVRDELYVAAYVGDPNVVRMTVYGNWEEVKYDSLHRNIGAGACAAATTGLNCFDPFRSEPPTATAYNWKAKIKDRNWSAGVGVDWPVMDRLMVKAAYLYYETDGGADMQSQNAGGDFGTGSPSFFGNPLPIAAFDDTKKHSFNLKGIYTLNKNWSLTAGYAYEKYEYTDTRYDGYQYTIPFPPVTNNASQSYLSGYNAFPQYKANIFYGLVTYRF